MLIAKLLPSQSIFMHLEYKNDHTYFLAFTAAVFLNYLKFAKKKQNTSILETLTKIAHIVDGGVY